MSEFTLVTVMGNSMDGYKEWWKDNLKVIIFAHNSSVQASRVLTLSPAVRMGAAASRPPEYSPYCLLYGWEPQLFTEVNTAIVYTIIA